MARADVDLRVDRGQPPRAFAGGRGWRRLAGRARQLDVGQARRTWQGRFEIRDLTSSSQGLRCPPKGFQEFGQPVTRQACATWTRGRRPSPGPGGPGRGEALCTTSGVVIVHLRHPDGHVRSMRPGRGSCLLASIPVCPGPSPPRRLSLYSSGLPLASNWRRTMTSSRSRSLLFLACLIAAAGVPAALAQTPPLSPEFQLNTFTTGDERNPTVFLDSAGKASRLPGNARGPDRSRRRRQCLPSERNPDRGLPRGPRQYVHDRRSVPAPGRGRFRDPVRRRLDERRPGRELHGRFRTAL